ncbi:MAG: GlsB/YeaQ/YmgE family stress response membrane protein [Verrucomicrobia bacterium]|nr:GlsB/YeaQ/YmgE family stress response membrane protein [Verrucomicrobiota bacterium]
MNTISQKSHQWFAAKWLIAGLALFCLGSLPALAWSSPVGALLQQTTAMGSLPGIAVTDTVDSAKEAVRDAGRAAEKTFENLWRTIDGQRLRNRTPDQIVAWIIMGALVGAVAGMATSLKTSGLGKVGRFVLGLAGAFIGGVVVQIASIDFGWGPVLIRYEDLLFALVGALVLILVGRFVRARFSKRSGSSS